MSATGSEVNLNRGKNVVMAGVRGAARFRASVRYHVRDPSARQGWSERRHGTLSCATRSGPQDTRARAKGTTCVYLTIALTFFSKAKIPVETKASMSESRLSSRLLFGVSTVLAPSKKALLEFCTLVAHAIWERFFTGKDSITTTTLLSRRCDEVRFRLVLTLSCASLVCARCLVCVASMFLARCWLCWILVHQTHCSR